MFLYRNIFITTNYKRCEKYEKLITKQINRVKYYLKTVNIDQIKRYLYHLKIVYFTFAIFIPNTSISKKNKYLVFIIGNLKDTLYKDVIVFF